MFEEINRQMEEALQGVYRLQKIDSMLSSLNDDQLLLETRVSELKAALEKEDQDVIKLESKSLAHLFYTMLGGLEKKAEKERQEALSAKLKYDQAVQELENVKTEISKLNSERIDYRNCKSNYDNLYAQKRELLLQSGAETADQLLSITDKYEKSKNNLKEIREAISAGEAVMQRIRITLDSLTSAQNWGTWDLLGGGLITDMIKHSHIDEAKGSAEMIQMQLIRFKTELADIRINQDIHFETGGFVKFADFFFDGLISDWVMQSRINDSKDSVIRVQNQVQSVMAKLKSLDNKENEYSKQLEHEINALIMNA